MRTQNRMRRVIAAGLLVAGALFTVSPAAADDWETCVDSLKSDVVIAACTRAIDSGQFTTQNLAALYTSRGIAYGFAGERDRAVQDFEQAIRLDPQLSQSDRADPVAVADGRFIFCCRAALLDCRIKATWAIRDLGENTDDRRCVTACFQKPSC